MKKFIVFLIGAVSISFDSYAIWPDLTPLSSCAPQFCAQCTGEQMQTLKSAVEMVQQITSREGQKQMFNQIEAHAKSYAMDKGNNLLEKYKNKRKGNSEEKPISYTRMIKMTKTDLNNVDAVQDAFKRYFLYVPSRDEEVQASYKEKREQFIEDTTLELYITAKEMDKELKAMLAKLDNIQKCLIDNNNDDCRAEGMEEYNCQKDDGSEDEMCYRRNLLLAATLYDEIMKYNEYLLAMQAQYEAVRNLGNGVQPVEKSKQSDKEAFSSYTEESFAFASQSDDDNKALVIGDIPDSGFDFTDETSIDLKTPLADKEGDIKALEVFQEAQKHISAAIESHNLKHQLPEFKEVFELYHDTDAEHKRTLKQLATSQRCVLNYLSKRYSNSEKVWLDNCNVDEMHGFVCSYNPPKSSADNSDSKGVYDVFCYKDAAHKCYVLNSDSYDEIGGMSGWLADMYLKAKDELSDTSADSDNYVVSASSLDPQSGREAGPNTGSYSADKLKYQVSGDEILVDKYKENMRVLSRLGMSIGILANEEINRDTNGASGSSKFGVSTKPFPLWNDQVNFYNQYIDDKYKNIWDYFNEAPLWKNILNIGSKINEEYEYEPLRDEEGNLIKTAEELRKEAAKAIETLLKGLADEKDDVLEKIETVLAEEKAKLQEVTTQHLSNLQKLNSERIVLYKQLENVNVNEANLNNEVTKQDSVINYADGYNSAAEGGVAMDAEYRNPKNPRKPYSQTLQENINQQKANESAAESAREEAVSALGNGASREEILDAINAKEAEIKAERSNYVFAYYNAEQEYGRELENIVEELYNKDPETGAVERQLSIAQQAVKDAIPLFPVLAQAEILAEQIRQYALQEVEKVIDKIEGMKNNGANGLYYAENNPKVVQMHSDMLKKIIEPDVDDMAKELELDAGKTETLKKYAENLVGAFSDICDGVNCYQPDDKYFVGILAQKKDMAAPKSPVNFSSAPMREMFSFGLEDIDYLDHCITDSLKLVAKEYDVLLSGSASPMAGFGFGLKGTIKIKKSEIAAGNKADISTEGAKVLLLAKSFPESGIEIPEIWKIVLSYRPFVQKNIDLEKFLSNGDESVALARSGIYPCISAGTIVDVTPNGDGTVRYVKLNKMPQGYTNLPQCQTVQYVDGGFIDPEAVENGNRIGELTAVEPKAFPNASELGNILQYKSLEAEIVGENGLPIVDGMGLELTPQKPEEIKYLTFRDEFLEALKKTSQIKDDNDLTAQYYMYNRILPQRSQFGDYLNKMDIERMALESEVRVRSRIYSSNVNDLVITNSIYKVFASMGYDFDREKFDLSNEDYYRQTENVLNERKESNIRAAKSLLGGNLRISSAGMYKRKNNLLNQIKLLEADKDEKAEIQGSESVAELIEKINNRNADEALKDKNKAETFSQKEEPVYCSVYGQ